MMNSKRAQCNVSPALAGVHKQLKALDSGLRRNDGNGRLRTYYKTIKPRMGKQPGTRC